jgi:hypothetical protein
LKNYHSISLLNSFGKVKHEKFEKGNCKVDFIDNISVNNCPSNCSYIKGICGGIFGEDDDAKNSSKNSFNIRTITWAIIYTNIVYEINFAISFFKFFVFNFSKTI